MLIDISYDFRTDAKGKDPDSHSPTLRHYHRILWSKPLPNGSMFDLDDKLRHRSVLGEFFLSSDAATPTYSKYTDMQKIISEMPKEDINNFVSIAYTIGAFIVFPCNKIDNNQTINCARGLKKSISDRFDLTLECIRRYYEGGESPLSKTLALYGDFFSLFSDFSGYVDFFLLQDMVDNQGDIRFFMPFDDFPTLSKPNDVETYIAFRQNTIEFINARNQRIFDWTQKN